MVFVSNSSSSSFLIIGKVLSSFDEVANARDPYCIGHDLEEGLDVFPVTKEILYIMKKEIGDEIFGDYEFIDAVCYKGDNADFVLDQNIAKGNKIITGTADNGCSDETTVVENYRSGGQ